MGPPQFADNNGIQTAILFRGEMVGVIGQRQIDWANRSGLPPFYGSPTSLVIRRFFLPDVVTKLNAGNYGCYRITKLADEPLIQGHSVFDQYPVTLLHCYTVTLTTTLCVRSV